MRDPPGRLIHVRTAPGQRHTATEITLGICRDHVPGSRRCLDVLRNRVGVKDQSVVGQPGNRDVRIAVPVQISRRSRSQSTGLDANHNRIREHPVRIVDQHGNVAVGKRRKQVEIAVLVEIDGHKTRYGICQGYLGRIPERPFTLVIPDSDRLVARGGREVDISVDIEITGLEVRRRSGQSQRRLYDEGCVPEVLEQGDRAGRTRNEQIRDPVSVEILTDHRRGPGGSRNRLGCPETAQTIVQVDGNRTDCLVDHRQVDILVRIHIRDDQFGHRAADENLPWCGKGSCAVVVEDRDRLLELVADDHIRVAVTIQVSGSEHRGLCARRVGR